MVQVVNFAIESCVNQSFSLEWRVVYRIRKNILEFNDYDIMMDSSMWKYDLTSLIVNYISSFV